MSDAPPVKSQSYALIVGEKENAILACMLQLMFYNTTIFSVLLNQVGVSKEELTMFLKNIADREHEQGWCHDPNCKEKPKTTTP